MPALARHEMPTRLSALPRAEQAKSFTRRRRWQRVRRWTAALALALMAGAGAYAWWIDAPALLQTESEKRLQDFAVQSGMVINRITVEGAHHVSAEDVTRVLGIQGGDPMMGLDLATARLNIEQLGWVAHAEIRRELPDHLIVTISERRPYAIWQDGNEFHLIDRTGALIGQDGLNSFQHLPLVVGAGAPAHAAQMIDLLASTPDLALRVQASVRVGDRRWDVVLEEGPRIMLPAENAAQAWRYFTFLNSEQRLLDRPLARIDLRLLDRVVIQPLPPEQARVPAADGQGG